MTRDEAACISALFLVANSKRGDTPRDSFKAANSSRETDYRGILYEEEKSGR